MKRNKPIVDGIQFDSNEEVEVYVALKEKKLHILTGIEELKKFKLVNARPNATLLCEGFKAGDKVIRKRVYTHDFDILNGKEEIMLEVKSKWTEAKPDYRLRRFLFLFFNYNTKKFAELIKVKKGVWKYIKYFK